MRHLSTAIVLLACVLASAPAAAQWLATDDRPEMISLSTVTSTAVVVGTIMLTVVSVKKEPTAMRRYLRANEPAVRAALTIGGGEIIADIAAFFEVPRHHHDAFAAVLRQHRTGLLAAIYRDDDVDRFVAIVLNSFAPSA